MQLGLLLNLHRLKRCQLGLKGGGNVPGEVAKMETYPYLSPVYETVRCSFAPKAQEQANLSVLSREKTMALVQSVTPLAAKQRRQLGTSIISLLLFTVGGYSIIPPEATLAQEVIPRVLTVTGQGETMIPTTLTRVSAGVEVEATTAEAAQAEAARRSSTVVDLLRSRNVDKLETTGIRLNPVYSYNTEPPQVRAYQAVNTVSFQIPTDAAGTLLDDIVQAGATRIGGISFIATESAIADARDTALQTATQDAQRQASVVLDSLNFSSQEIIGIQINGANPPTPLPLAQAARQEFAEADYTTPVVGGEQIVRATVTLQIRY